MADSDDEVEAPRPDIRQRAAPAAQEAAAEGVAAAVPRPRRRRGVAAEPPAEEAAEEGVAAAEPAAVPRPRRRRGAAAEPPAEEAAEEAAEDAAEEDAGPSGPRRSSRRPARSPAVRRRNLRESRRILAESGINAENAREGVEGGEDMEVGEQQEAVETGEIGPLGMIGAMLKRTVNYLKTDPYRNAFDSELGEEPYPSLRQLYETVKENPNSPETLRQVTSDFRTLKQSYHNSGCDTDVNISLNPKCLGVQAGLYMRLFDIRKSIDDSLEQMKPIQQQAVLARINREARPEYNDEEGVFVPAGV
jgi:hypothetical protein